MEREQTQTQNPFFKNIEPRFQAFKKNIMRLCAQNHYEFNEDVFMNTIIRCMSTFTKEDMTNTEVDKYFWTAFRQNMLSSITRDKFKNKVNIDVIPDTFIDVEYNPAIDEIMGIIETAVVEEFGQKIYDAWKLHVCEKYTYEELENMGYEGLNLHNEFRQIKRYVTGKLITKNAYLKTLLVENNFL